MTYESASEQHSFSRPHSTSSGQALTGLFVSHISTQDYVLGYFQPCPPGLILRTHTGWVMDGLQTVPFKGGCSVASMDGVDCVRDYFCSPAKG
jgi:hypothetical protein